MEPVHAEGPHKKATLRLVKEHIPLVLAEFTQQRGNMRQFLGNTGHEIWATVARRWVALLRPIGCRLSAAPF